MSSVVVPKTYAVEAEAAGRLVSPLLGDETPVAVPPRRLLRRILVRHKRNLTLLFTLVVLVLVAGAIYRIGQNIQPAAVFQALSATAPSAIWLAVLFTALSFASLVCYDLSALRYVGRRLPGSTVAFTAFCAYAIGNVTGIGALSGGAIRLRYYGRAGLPADEIAKVVAFVALAFGLGVTVLTALALLLVPDSLHALVGGGAGWLKTGAAALLGVTGLAFVAGPGWLPAGRWAAVAPSRATAARQLFVTALDLAASAGVLYVLLPAPAVSFPAFLGIFVVATGAGVLSHVPAGLGVFETIVVAALGPAVELHAVLGALVLYRVVYQIVPMGLALGLLGGAEACRYAQRHRVMQLFDVRGGVRAALLAALAGVTGLAMLLSGPDRGAGFDVAPLPAAWMALLHLLPAVFGGALILSARGLMRRIDGAWWVCALGLAGGLPSTLATHGVSCVSALLAMALGALWAGRSLFQQPALLLAPRSLPAWRAAAASLAFGVGLILLVGRTTPPDHADLWWTYWLSDAAPDGLQAVLACAVLVAAAGLLALLRPVAVAAPAPTADSLESALRIVDAQASAAANLVRMGDKSVLFSTDGRAFIMYAKRGRSWIALFDPVGPQDAWPGLIAHFIEAARGAGCRAVFYQVSPDVLPHSADAGLRAFKLGEQAMVDLTRFDLKGGKWASLRRSINRAARDGLAFTVVEPASVPALLDDLKAVSDAWLAHHNVREKSFSIGAFDPAYLAAQPLAVLRLDGRIVAFATLLATNMRHDVFIDLMRHVPGVHRGGMDLLFVEIIEYLKREGFQTLNLGMAPLAGLSNRSTAPLWNKIAGAVFECGERLYNFKGLLAFKSKFDPDWQPRYLVVAGGINPYLAVMDVAILIGGGVRGVFRK